MLKLPSYKFCVTFSQRKRYWKLRADRKAILKRYKKFFSPRKLSVSPFSELEELYAKMLDEDPDVLYYFLVKLCRSLSLDPTAGNLCIGVFSGLLASETLAPLISGIVNELPNIPNLGKLIYIVLLLFLAVLISAILLFSAKYLTVFFVPDSISETEAEIIYRLLALDQYFPSEDQAPAAVSKWTSALY